MTFAAVSFQYSAFAQEKYINIRGSVENCILMLKKSDFHVNVIVDMINNEYGSEIVTKKQVQGAMAALKKQYGDQIVKLGYGWHRWA